MSMVAGAWLHVAAGACSNPGGPCSQEQGAQGTLREEEVEAGPPHLRRAQGQAEGDDLTFMDCPSS